MKRAKNILKENLRKGQPQLGIEFMTESHRLIEIAGWSGFDYIQFDMEHTSHSFADIEGFVRTADGVGLTSLVRVADGTSTDIRRVLETGAHGVIVPQIRDAEHARESLAATRYAPAGTRGMCPVTRAARYSEESWEAYVEWTADELMVVVLVESVSALEEIESICAVPGIDAIGFGAGDMGQNMGVGGRGMAAEEVRTAFERVRTAAAAHGIPLLAMPVIDDDPFDSVRALIGSGTGLVTFDADALMFQRQCRLAVEGFRAVRGEVLTGT